MKIALITTTFTFVATAAAWDLKVFMQNGQAINAQRNPDSGCINYGPNVIGIPRGWSQWRFKVTKSMRWFVFDNVSDWWFKILLGSYWFKAWRQRVLSPRLLLHKVLFPSSRGKGSDYLYITTNLIMKFNQWWFIIYIKHNLLAHGQLSESVSAWFALFYSWEKKMPILIITSTHEHSAFKLERALATILYYSPFAKKWFNRKME